jgi:cyclohexa-1,5-dienecarbonyl-CoA hydratase
MGYEAIKVEERFNGCVHEVSLGPAPANIVTGQVVDEVGQALEVAQRNPSVKLFVLTGEGDHFSYGASVEEHRAEVIREVLPRLNALVGRMLDCPLPTLAKVSGLCLGGGFELALGCSMIFADEGAKMGVPEIKLGVFPPVAAVLLPFCATPARAARLVLSGEMIKAPEARDAGIVTTMAAPGELDAVVDAFIEKHILPKSASSLRFANTVVRSALSAHYQADILPAEQMYIEELMATADANEGIEAFLEKRAPVWKDA